MNILLTGSTGHIGQRMVRSLASSGHQLYLLVRPKSKKRAKEIFKDLSSIIFIEGDIEDTDVLKNIYAVSHHIETIECVVHLAAFYNLEATQLEAYMKNVVGTQNILHLMTKMPKLKNFHYFSTYAVNPISQGVVSEEFLVQDDLAFHDEYSKTKNHAEHLVRKNNIKSVNTVIYRPGIIIGDSKTGEMTKTDGPYYFFDFIDKIKKIKSLKVKIPFLPMPVTSQSFFPVLPVDILTEWCTHIISNPPEAKLKCYHLVPNPVIKTQEFLEDSMKLLDFPVRLFPVKYTQIISPLLPFLKIPKEAAFYMTQETIFDRSHLNKDYPELKCPAYSDYLPTIIMGHFRSKK